jgi:hypothetical protein
MKPARPGVGQSCTLAGLDFADRRNVSVAVKRMRTPVAQRE